MLLWLSREIQAKLDVAAMKRYTHVARAAHELDSRMLFTKAVVKTAMGIIAEQLGDSWGLTSDHKSDWIDTMTTRFRNFTAHIHAAETRRQTPAWARDCLPLLHGGTDDTIEGGKDDEIEGGTDDTLKGDKGENTKGGKDEDIKVVIPDRRYAWRGDRLLQGEGRL